MLAKDRLDRLWQDAATVDPEEIERYAALAEEWWNPNGRFKPMHKFNPVRQAVIVRRLACHFDRNIAASQAPIGVRVLDVGCGGGLLCEPLAAPGATVVGIDATAGNVEIARWHAARSGLEIDYRHCLADHLLEADERFDAVLNTEVVEHVADPRRLRHPPCPWATKPTNTVSSRRRVPSRSSSTTRGSVGFGMTSFVVSRHFLIFSRLRRRTRQYGLTAMVYLKL